MNVELINTGSELMLGFVLNTHQQWMCRQLADLGYVVTRQVAISDRAQPIQGAVRDAMDRAELIFTTGGLGPTADDITRDLLAALLGRKLVMDESIVDDIRAYFASRKRVMPERVKVQGLIPEGAVVFRNHHGTAPGLALQTPRGWLIMLPGPPRELRPMFTNQVVPFLAANLPAPEAFHCRILKTAGLGESLVEERVEGPLAALMADGLEVGYCARVGEVDVRLVARGSQGAAKVEQAEVIVRDALKGLVFGMGGENLEQVIVQRLTALGQTLALAESCTGGFLANRITNVPGASAVLLAGLVTYSNEAKQKLLGVASGTLEQHGAVSEATAREMAEGARRATGADWGVGITGIAGPGGGSAEKPVGTVHIALAGPDTTQVRHSINAFDRETFKYVTSQQVLEMLRRKLG